MKFIISFNIQTFCMCFASSIEKVFYTNQFKYFLSEHWYKYPTLLYIHPTLLATFSNGTYKIIPYDLENSSLIIFPASHTFPVRLLYTHHNDGHNFYSLSNNRNVSMSHNFYFAIDKNIIKSDEPLRNRFRLFRFYLSLFSLHPAKSTPLCITSIRTRRRFKMFPHRFLSTFGFSFIFHILVG